jgi:phosphopantetheine adenylyltransferase
MDIDVYFGTLFNFSSKAPGLLLDFFFTFLGAFLGFLSAIVVQRYFDKKSQKSRLEYLREILLSIIETSRNQTLQLTETIEAIDNDPYNFHRINRFASLDIDRYLKFDSHELYQAYLGDSKNSQEQRRNFKRLNNFIDHLYESFNEIKVIADNYRKYTYERQYQIKDLVEEVSNQCASVIERIRLIEGENYRENIVFIFFNNSLGIFHDAINAGQNLEFVLDNFIDPLRIEIINRNYHLIPELQLIPLLENCKKAMLLKNDLRVDSDQTRLDFLEFNNGITETLDRLDELMA